MPAGKTYTRVANQTLGSASASVTFSNLPQNFTDLVVVLQVKNSGGNGYATQLQYNGDTGNNYSWMGLAGYASSSANTYKGNNTNIQKIGFSSATSGTVWTPMIVQIMNYSSTSAFKTYVSRSNSIDGNSYVHMGAGVWRNTAAITSLTFTSEASSTFASGSTFTIYGIEAAKSPYAEGGDKVYSTGTHWVHEFYNSGTFVPRQNLTCDYLVVAGGGGGGTGGGGAGGGAGGLRSTVTATGGGGSLESALSLTASIGYTVTVGAGGAARTSGNNSVFSTITSTGGGFGGSRLPGEQQPATGGSGGGGFGDSVNSSSGASGTANQGYAGGNNQFGAGPNYGAGGGGGSGAVGANASGSTSGNGGAGVAVSISGSSITYAGGGGGGSTNNGATRGTGGAGGGGNGGAGATGSAGTANTGGGGGGGGNAGANVQVSGAAGGSGIVIVRYPV